MQKKHLGLILASTGPFLWGSSGTVAQHLFNTTNITTMWLVATRMFISGALLLLYALVRRVPIMPVFRQPRTAVKLVAFSIFGMVGAQLTYFMAISTGNAATAAILQFLSPVIVILYLAVANWAWPGKVDVISVFLAVIGTVLIVTQGHLNSLALPVAAVVWGLLAAVGATAYTLMPGPLLRTYGAIPIVGWSMLIGGVLVALTTGAWQHWPTLSVENWVAVGFVVLFGTMLAYLFFLQSLEFIMPTTASVLGAIEPLAATILSVIFLKISFNFWGLLGAVMIVGITLLQFWAAKSAGFETHD